VCSLDGRDWRSFRRRECARCAADATRFQGPIRVAQPGMRVRSTSCEGIDSTSSRAPRERGRIVSLLEMVGRALTARALPRTSFPAQRQRIGIARALAVNPRFLGSTNRLRVRRSIQAQSSPAAGPQERLHLTYLFIAHDSAWSSTSASARRSCTWVKLWVGRARRNLRQPTPSLTRALLSAIRHCMALSRRATSCRRDAERVTRRPVAASSAMPICERYCRTLERARTGRAGTV